MGKAENYVEGYLTRRINDAGGLCLKFTSSIVGVPDRIIILNGHTLFVEAKSLVGKPSAIQLHRIEKMRDAGADVRLIGSRELVDDLLEELLTSPAESPVTLTEQPVPQPVG